jgi:hypothetical protein
MVRITISPAQVSPRRFDVLIDGCLYRPSLDLAQAQGLARQLRLQANVAGADGFPS